RRRARRRPGELVLELTREAIRRLRNERTHHPPEQRPLPDARTEPALESPVARGGHDPREQSQHRGAHPHAVDLMWCRIAVSPVAPQVGDMSPDATEVSR